MKNCCYFILCLFLLPTLSLCQKEDHFWLMGRASSNPSTPDSLWTPFQYNFNADPMKLEYTPYREWDFSGMCSSICDEKGALYCYSNGMFIVDSTHKWMLGGEKINYNDYWEKKKQKLSSGKFYYPGYLIPQGNIFLDWPGNNDKIIYFSCNTNGSYIQSITQCNINKIGNGGKGEVELKDFAIIDNTKFKDGGLQATRHANGRDWWLIVENTTMDTLFTFYINSDTVMLHNTTKLTRPMTEVTTGNNMFSQQGDKYASINGYLWSDNDAQLILMDFDRATGILSNPKYDKLPGKWGTLGFGVIFSPNGRYLYANSNENLYQYDLSKNDFPKSKDNIANYDGFISWCTHDSSFCALPTFGFWQYGPDGKLYNVSDYGTSRHMHRMEFPDEEGTDCQFTQHAIFTPNNPWTIPNFPNFRLGPLDGSPADTLGIDNHPIAKFRYEADTLDHLNVRFTDLSYFRPETWHWDFGDGTTFEGKKPYWHSFPKNGTYNVCLTVSNENSENTTCRLVTIGSSSGIEHSAKGIDYVNVFPNPVETEMLITISEYIPEHGEVVIYDVMGNELHKQRVYYGWNNINMINLSVGTYIYVVKDKGQKIGEGRVVKI